MVYPACAGCRARIDPDHVLVCPRCWSFAVTSCLSKTRYESADRARGRITHSKAAQRLAAANPQAVPREIDCPLCQGVHHATSPIQRPSKTRNLHRTLAAMRPVYPQLYERYQQARADQALQDLTRRRGRGLGHQEPPAEGGRR